MNYLFWWRRRQRLREWKLGGVPPPDAEPGAGFGRRPFGQYPFGGGELEEEKPVGRGSFSNPLARRLPTSVTLRSGPGAADQADEAIPAGQALLPDRGRHWVARPVLAYSLILSFAIPPAAVVDEALPPGRGIVAEPRRAEVRTIVGIRSGPGAADEEPLPPQAPVGTIVIDLPRADQPRLVPLSGGEFLGHQVPPEGVPVRADLGRPQLQRRRPPEGLFPRGVPPLAQPPPSGAIELFSDLRMPRRAARAAYWIESNLLVHDALPPGQRIDLVPRTIRRADRTAWEGRQGPPPPDFVAPSELPPGKASLAEPQRVSLRPDFALGRIPPPDAQALPPGTITRPEPQRRPRRPDFALGQIPPPDAVVVQALPPGQTALGEPLRRPLRPDFALGRIPPPDAIQAPPPGQSVLVQPAPRSRPPHAPPVGGLAVDEPIPPGDQIDSRRVRTPRATESAYNGLLSQVPPPEKLPEGARLEARRVRTPRASEAAYRLVATFATPAALPLPVELQASIQPSTAPGPRRAGPGAYWLDNLLAVEPPQFPLPIMERTFVEFVSPVPGVEYVTGSTRVEHITGDTSVEFEG